MLTLEMVDCFAFLTVLFRSVDYFTF